MTNGPKWYRLHIETAIAARRTDDIWSVANRGAAAEITASDVPGSLTMVDAAAT
jgi:hypothetical protein